MEHIGHFIIEKYEVIMTMGSFMVYHFDKNIT